MRGYSHGPLPARQNKRDDEQLFRLSVDTTGMVDSANKPGSRSPWHSDRARFFAHDAPQGSWQLRQIAGDVGLADLNEDGRCHDDAVEVAQAFKTLRKGKKPTFVVGLHSADLARETWLANREGHQAALVASRGESVESALQSVAPLVDPTAPMCAEDDFVLPHPVETAILGKAMGDPNWQRRMGVRHLSRHDVAQYVEQKGVDLIADLVIAQGDQSVNYRHQMVVAIKFGDTNDPNAAYGIRVVEGDDPLLQQLSDVWCFLTYERLGMGLEYALRFAEGTGAMDQGLAWLRSQGIFVTDALELRFLAGTWGTRMQGRQSRITGADDDALKPVQWSQLEDRLLQEGSRFFSRLQTLAWPKQNRRDAWVFAASYKDEAKGVFARNIRAVAEGEFDAIGDECAKLLIRWHQRLQQDTISRVGGEHSFELGLKWAESQGIGLTTATRALLARYWKFRFKPKSGERPLWNELKSELAEPGTLHRWVEMRALIDPSFEPETASLHLTVMRRGGIYSGLQLLTDEEFRKANPPDSVYHVHVVKMANGEWGVRRQPSEKQKSLVAGMTLAPDATQMDEAAQQALAWGGENFGNLDEQLCKPEPLITPADVMPVPQLERPADVVILPKMEGFIGTDPEAVKNFQTPPSDRIPVITRPREAPAPETADTTLLIIIAAGLLAVADGPLPFGDIAAASLLGGKLAFQ